MIRVRDSNFSKLVHDFEEISELIDSDISLSEEEERFKLKRKIESMLSTAARLAGL